MQLRRHVQRIAERLNLCPVNVFQNKHRRLPQIDL